MIFGTTLARGMRSTEAATIARFLRREPLWPLFRAIWKFRRMDDATFAMCDVLLDPLGAIGQDVIPR